jgi:3-phosphoinositide dependent protein kinase-1
LFSQIDFGDSNYVKKKVIKEISQENLNPDDETLQKSSSDVDQENKDGFKDQNLEPDRKGTFVGTAFYVSPEMLSQNIALPSSDLWALGVAIYKMVFGDVPFCGSHDYQTF